MSELDQLEELQRENRRLSHQLAMDALEMASKYAQMEKERDQWRKCAHFLAPVARTIGWTSAESTKTLKMAEVALQEFDNLNTP